MRVQPRSELANRFTVRAKNENSEMKAQGTLNAPILIQRKNACGEVVLENQATAAAQSAWMSLAKREQARAPRLLAGTQP